MLKKRTSKLEIILSLVAVIICIAIFLKAIIDVDNNYDIGWYHLPFSARIWGIIPESSFLAGAKVEDRFDGFPLLAHFFQGLFWKITNRVQSTNLVGYFSLIIYFFFLRGYFRVPLYLSAIALFSIPAVLTHAATSFVDLPGNIGASVAVMMIYRFFCSKSLPNKKELLAAFLGAAMAANTKPQLTVLMVLVWTIAIIRLIWLYVTNTQFNGGKAISALFLSAIASGLIFATPIKNVVLYGNPVYPVKVQVAGIVLNHRTTPATYSEGNRPQKWLQSILEINTPEWSADQFNRTNDERLLDRAGGFFGAYVIFNLLLLILFNFKKTSLQLNENNQVNSNVALIILIIASIFVANFPQSHELRYLMFWMITLVSLNLSMISVLSENTIFSWLKKQYIWLIFLCFLAIMCARIKSYYLIPDFRTLQVYLNSIINIELLKEVVPNQQNCFVSQFEYYSTTSVLPQQLFYYSAYFHPEIGFDYSIKAVEDTKQCGESKIITYRN